MLGNYCRFSFEELVDHIAAIALRTSPLLAPCGRFRDSLHDQVFKDRGGSFLGRLASPLRPSFGVSPRWRIYVSSPDFASRFTRASSSPGTRFLEDSFRRVNLFFRSRRFLFRLRFPTRRRTLASLGGAASLLRRVGAVSTFTFTLPSTSFRHFVSALPSRCRPRLRSGGGLL